jgi:hypothetical protein
MSYDPDQRGVFFFVIIEPFPHTYQAERVRIKTPCHGGGWLEGHALTVYRGRWAVLYVGLEMPGQTLGVPLNQLETVQVLKRGRWYTVRQ